MTKRSEPGSPKAAAGNFTRLARNPAILAAGALTAAMLLSSCAEAEPPQIEISNVSSQGVELPDSIAKDRTKVLELCNTGEGASEMRDLWKSTGYEESTGKTWLDAFTFETDFGYYDDPNTVLAYGDYVYPTVLGLAENCQEAAFMLSGGAKTSAIPKDALPALEEFRKNGDINEVITKIYNDLKGVSAAADF